MELILEKLQGLLLFTAALLILGLLTFRLLKRNFDRPGSLIAKWAVTGAIGYGYLFHLQPMSKEGGAGALYAVMIATVVGVALAVMWAPAILDRVTRPIMDMFAGGWFTDSSKPYYALAKGRRKRGEFEEALVEIDRQLEKFPDDTDGRLLKAEIKAEDLSDVAAAKATIDDLLALDEPASKNVETALRKLADWSLRIEGDPISAEGALQQLIGLFPETKTATMAAQLIRRIPDRERLRRHPASRNALKPANRDQRVKVSKTDAVTKPPTSNGPFDTVDPKAGD